MAVFQIMILLFYGIVTPHNNINIFIMDRWTDFQTKYALTTIILIISPNNIITFIS